MAVGGGPQSFRPYLPSPLPWVSLTRVARILPQFPFPILPYPYPDSSLEAEAVLSTVKGPGTGEP